MRLLNNYTFLITLFLSLLNFTIATDRNIVSNSENGIGCTGTLSSSNTGFIASVYNFPLFHHGGFYSDTWVANSYTTEEL